MYFFKRFSVFSSGNLSQTSGWRMFFSESPMRLVCTLCVSRSTTARRMDDQPCLPLWYLRSSDSFFSFLSTDLSVSPAARMTESSEKSWFSSGFTSSALTCFSKYI